MWRSRGIRVGLAVALLVTGGMAYAFSRSSGPSAVIHGPDLISTRLPPGLFADVEQALHDRQAKYIPDEQGRLSDPTFKQSGQSWSSGVPSHQVLARTSTEFVNRQGHRVRIESLWEGGDQAWHFIEYDGPGGPLAVTNELSSLLRERGVEVGLE